MAEARSLLHLDGAAFARSLHICPRLAVAYVNNPKAACSTIKLTLQRAELKNPAYRPATSVHDQEESPLLTGSSISGHETGLLAGKFLFSFVRNPFERLRSVYSNKIVHPQKMGRFREQAGFHRDHCPTFDEFVLAVCNQTPQEQNAHWRLQALNLSTARLRFDFIGRLENFSQDWRHLARRTGLPPRADFAGKRSDASGKAAQRFTRDMIEAVLETYRPDFEEFGYSPCPENAAE